MTDKRIEREIAHGKSMMNVQQGRLWYWSSPAGQIRCQRRIDMLTDGISTDMKVLEVGCGTGCLTAYFAKTRARITAIDISEDFLFYARRDVKADNVIFMQANAYDLSFNDSEFDVVLGSSALHHFDVDKALKEFYRVLKPGGFICFTEPNYRNPHVYLERKVPFLKKYFYVSDDEIAFVKGKLIKQLESHGFERIYVYPFDFLHPSTPVPLIPMIDGLGHMLEKTPLVKEIAGSLYARAYKPL